MSPLWTTFSSSQGILLAQHSEVTFKGTQRTLLCKGSQQPSGILLNCLPNTTEIFLNYRFNLLLSNLENLNSEDFFCPFYLVLLSYTFLFVRFWFLSQTQWGQISGQISGAQGLLLLLSSGIFSGSAQVYHQYTRD